MIPYSPVSIKGSTSNSLKDWVIPLTMITATAPLPPNPWLLETPFLLSIFCLPLTFWPLSQCSWGLHPAFSVSWSKSWSPNNRPALLHATDRVHTCCGLSLNRIILPHSNPSSDRVLIKYTNQNTENAYGKSSNTAYLGWFVFAAYLNSNAKQQELCILAGKKNKRKWCATFLLSHHPLFFVSFIFDCVKYLCIAFSPPKHWLSLKLWF